MSNPTFEELSERVDSLQAELERLLERNARVETDKAWEASAVRVIFLVGITYLVTAVVFRLIAVPSPLMNALIPTTGYYLSTLSLPIVRKWWVARRKS